VVGNLPGRETRAPRRRGKIDLLMLGILMVLANRRDLGFYWGGLMRERYSKEKGDQ